MVQIWHKIYSNPYYRSQCTYNPFSQEYALTITDGEYECEEKWVRLAFETVFTMGPTDEACAEDLTAKMLEALGLLQ